MEIVSGRTGSPHVTSQQFRQLVEGTVGQESYILTSGENLEPELASNNILKIRSGMMSHHGNISSIKIGTYDEVELTNGSQGMKRIDLVVNRYTRNAETNVEANNWVVITGTPVASDPAVPAYTVGNLQKGDLTDDCPVFEVHYDGLNVTEIKKLLDVADNLGKMKKELAELNGNYANNVRFIPFTMTPSGTGNSSAFITNIAKINSLFGITDATQQNSGAVIMNGDGNADSLHAEGVTWRGENLYAVFNKNVNGRFRITGLLYYSPAGAITLS